MRCSNTAAFFTSLAVLLVPVSCEQKVNNPGLPAMAKFTQITKDQWSNLIKKKIYFGHQSVGYNIISGVQDVFKENNLPEPNLKETRQASDFIQPVFAHSQIGKNIDPKSKVDDFVDLMEIGVGKNVDIAFFKFCYVDIDGETDINGLYHYYVNSMQKLMKEYPKVKFIHVTVPLTATSVAGIKARIKELVKKIIGRETVQERSVKGNLQRNRFNELLVKKYGVENVFDLALAESSYPDGRREFLKWNNQAIYALVPGYTHDGGHLNEYGRKIIAAGFLEFLIKASETR